MFSWLVTKTQARPLQAVNRLSAIVCRLVINLTLSLMYCPTSSTKKLSRKRGSPCASIYSATRPAKSSIDKVYVDRDSVSRRLASSTVPPRTAT